MLILKDLDGIGAQGFSICKRKGSRKNGLGGEGRLLYAPVIPLPDHFVTEQQKTVRRNGDSCGWIKMTFSLCKVHLRTLIIIN